MKITRDESEFIFRALFCLIFIGLGGEHIVSDELIQKLMPAWVPFKRVVSVLCGLWLVFWGTFVLVGYRLRLASFALGLFLVVVTVLVHIPGVISEPELPSDYAWMWTILQRSNLVKNLCLLGVCFQLWYHDLGKYSLERYLTERALLND